MAYAGELGMDVRLLWVHAFVLWMENEPVFDKASQADIRAAMARLAAAEWGGYLLDVTRSGPVGLQT